jgi:hypothetical protein
MVWLHITHFTQTHVTFTHRIEGDNPRSNFRTDELKLRNERGPPSGRMNPLESYPSVCLLVLPSACQSVYVLSHPSQCQPSGPSACLSAYLTCLNIYLPICHLRGLRRRSAAAWLLGSRVQIPPRAWVFVSCVYMLLSCVGRGLCDGLITRP